MVTTTASPDDVVTTPPVSFDPIVTTTVSPNVATPAPSLLVAVDSSAVLKCFSVLTCPVLLFLSLL